ncbi:colicin-like pore-forming protein [Pantoea coffeiphila]|uniref:colicin-like pore-forming protein n=1 Tax=Pantoea coffeiphila TaxID=1465635 RepID=UPI00195F97F8|nr:colicin-like pore-forming protein [Pantoea coffeiphila]MBM7341056.1 hypothetical protein [Pantoea coffeiphila]
MGSHRCPVRGTGCFAEGFGFFDEIASKKSIAAADKAKLYNNAEVGKKIKSASEALALWNRHRASITSRLSAADKNALSNALNGLKQEQLSKQLDVFSKVLGSVSKNIDRLSIVREMSNSVKTGNWQPTFIRIETILAGAGAAELVALVFSAMAVTPMGIVAFALLLAATGSMIDEKPFEDLNCWISKF